MANGGTIFLAKVAETSPATQVKLLRFPQNNDSEVLPKAIPTVLISL
ncbi:MAG: sigma 54-interacting transcriptional regulator [bacterium]